jgi:hypothetical protein
LLLKVGRAVPCAPFEAIGHDIGSSFERRRRGIFVALAGRRFERRRCGIILNFNTTWRDTQRKTKTNNDLPASTFAKAMVDRRFRKHVGRTVRWRMAAFLPFPLSCDFCWVDFIFLFNLQQRSSKLMAGWKFSLSILTTCFSVC